MQDKGKDLGEKIVAGGAELCGSQISDGGIEGADDHGSEGGSTFIKGRGDCVGVTENGM